MKYRLDYNIGIDVKFPESYHRTLVIWENILVRKYT